MAVCRGGHRGLSLPLTSGQLLEGGLGPGASVPGALTLGGWRMGPALAESSDLHQGTSSSSWGGHYYTFTTAISLRILKLFFFNVLLVPALQQPGIIIHLSPPSSASLASPAPPLYATKELQTGLPV